MGPIRSFSSMNEDVRSHISEINHLVSRIRGASRRLTGGDGQEPIPIGTASGKFGAETVSPERPPLLIDLTLGLEALGTSVRELRAEVNYLEGFSETAEDMGKGAVYAGSGAR